MGFESINYQFVPSKAGSRNIKHVLQKMKATHVQNGKCGENFEEFVLYEDNMFWIDILIGIFSSLDFPSVSIMVALCNPPYAMKELKELVDNLLVECGGYIFDKYSKNKFTSLQGNNEIDFEESFLKKQKEFRKYYGDFSATISGDAVFEHIREISDK